jgi:hypothetical protein
MKDLEARGVFILVGPLEGTPDVLLVMRSDSADEAAQHLQSDPWTALNLLVVEKVMPWTIRLGALPGTREPAGINQQKSKRILPNASTVGRNKLRTDGTSNFDVNLTKSITFGETRRLELRWEALNALNHPQFVNVPQKNVLTSPPRQFLSRDFTDSGIRSMWVQVKLVF